jgi:hypothetical protein
MGMYPGVRSDSDMHTLGYKFKPWTAQASAACASSSFIFTNTATAGEHCGRQQHLELPAASCACPDPNISPRFCARLYASAASGKRQQA